MDSIYNEEELAKLEQDENNMTEEALIVMFSVLATTHSDLEKELRLFYQKYGKDGVVTYQEARKWVSERNHQRRITWLTILIGTTFSSLFSGLQPHFYKLISDVVAKEFDFFGVAIDTPKLSWGADDLTWLDRLADDVSAWEAVVLKDIKQSILTQKNIDELLEIINKRFITMENITERLAITETTATGSIARKAIFKELGITKYQYFAREDERTCEQCGSLHGLIFPISAYEVGVTAPCLHPMCRCFTVGIKE